MNRILAVFAIALAALISTHPAATAQQAGKMHRIGFLSVYGVSDPASQRWHQTFHNALRDHGWIVGRNLSIAHRWVRSRRECQTAGRRACLPGLVDELLAQRVELIVVHGGLPARLIQKKAPELPVVLAEASDAVGRGIVKSLAKPGGSITGLSSITPVLAEKRLELLKELVPGLSRVGVIWTADAPASIYGLKQMKHSARKTGLGLHPVELRRGRDLEKPFRDLASSGVKAIISTSGIVTTFGRDRTLDLTIRTGLPAIWGDVATVRRGALLSYNRDTNDLYRRAALFVHKILRGAKPADLPVEQPTRFNLAVNLKTAKALGITFPPSILLRATEVIE